MVKWPSLSLSQYFGMGAALGSVAMGGALLSRESKNNHISGSVLAILGCTGLSYLTYKYLKSPPRTIVFVLGGPGAGKGTQCERLAKELPLAHFSAGDLLREHCKSGTQAGNMVADMIKNGQIVPAEVTVNLLEAAMQKAMKERGIYQFLIDGFPRNMDNKRCFRDVLNMDCSFVLFFDCSEEVMVRRILGRNQGRTDDNMDTLKKRFKVFQEQTMPVVESYEKESKVKRVVADRSTDDIF